MKNIFKAFFSFIKNHKVWSILIFLIIVGLSWYAINGGSKNVEFETVSVTRASLTEIVTVTGNVRPLSDVSLAFERSGKVSEISVNVGSRVFVGQKLASISNADLLANLDQAKANLKKAEAVFGDSAVRTALDLAQAEISLSNTIRDSYTKADDAIRNKMYTLFSDPARYRAKLAFSTNAFLQEDIEEGKDEISDLLDIWYRSLNTFDDNSDLELYYNTAKSNLSQVKALLDKSAEAVNGLTPDASAASQAQIDIWKSNISTARTSINAAIDTLVGSFNQYKTADLSSDFSKNNTLVEEAGIEQAKAQVSIAEAELSKSVLISPIEGVVTNIDIKLGEIFSANKTAISIISYGDYEVESFVPEADISKVKINDQAKTTLDAYGDTVTFDTSVIKIDPSATVIDGVPTYKVTLKFINIDDRIRAGMTANLDILTNQKDNVLVIPSRVVTTRDDGKYVAVPSLSEESGLVEKKVVTGLRGSDGNVEVVSGLNEGELVISSTI